MPVFIRYHHLLDIFIDNFHCAIHLGSVRRRIMMLDFELSAEFRNHSVVEITSIVDDNPFGDTIATNEAMSDESGYHILGD